MRSVYLRRKGHTTRLVDQAIQELFAVGYTSVRDHYDSKQADLDLSDRVCKRMSMEHNIVPKLTMTHTGLMLSIEPNFVGAVVPCNTPAIFERVRTAFNYIFNK